MSTVESDRQAVSNPRQTSSVDFVIDENAGHLKSRARAPSPNRRGVIHQALSKRFWITGDLESVVYGKYCGEPACLIVLDFIFGFDSDSTIRRFKKAEIIIEFTAIPSSDETTDSLPPGDDPAVCNFAPRLLLGDATIEKLSRTRQLALPAMVSVGPVQAGVEPLVGKSRSYTKSHMMKIEGKPYRDEKHSRANQVIWTVKENPKQQDGIPGDLVVAAIVGYKGAFQAEVKVTVGMEYGIPMFAWPWSRQRPVSFKPEEGLGEGLKRMQWYPNLENITANDWSAIVIPRRNDKSKISWS